MQKFINFNTNRYLGVGDVDAPELLIRTKSIGFSMKSIIVGMKSIVLSMKFIRVAMKLSEIPLETHCGGSWFRRVATSDCKIHGHFSIQNHRFSGEILHSFCIFNRKINLFLAFMLQLVPGRRSLPPAR